MTNTTRTVLTWLVTIFLVSFSPLPIFADDDDLTFVLRVRPGAIERVVERFDLEVEERIAGQHVYLVERDDDDDDEDSLASFMAAVRAHPDVLSFEVNESISLPEEDDAALTPLVHDGPLGSLLSNRTLRPYYGDTAWTGYVQQPAAGRLSLPQTHQTGATGVGVVAVIDTGVDPLHPALATALVPGYDFIERTPDMKSEMEWVPGDVSSLLQQSTVAFLDGVPVTLNQRISITLAQSTVAFLDGSKVPSSFGHGTMVAGVVRLAAPTARIMPLRAFRPDGTSDLFHITQAIYYAVQNGATVINMSFSLPQESPELTRAINHAVSRNIACIASVGNQGVAATVFPAALPNVIGVASVGAQNQRSAFSNFGTPLVTVAAPGEGIVTTYPGGGYAAAWGTSYSAPFVAGAVAMIANRNPNVTPSEAKAAVRRATPLTPDMGAGLLNLPLAVAAPQ